MTATGSVTGLYGKLPAYGDFISRNVNSNFIQHWDEWLQHFISGSREQLGEQWLDIYLTSPIWRFVLSPGVIDNHVWAGVMMPSVDRVGRYFPFSVVHGFTSQVAPVNLLFNQADWFQSVEDQCLAALNGDLDADELIAALSDMQIHISDQYLPTSDIGNIGPVITDLNGHDANSLYAALPFVLNASLFNSLSSFSLWMTTGSERISPLMMSCQGLPPIGGIASMLDGQWQARNWRIPYNLQQAEQ